MQRPFASASSGLGPSGPSTLPAVWAAAVHIRGVTGVAVFDAETTAIWVAEAPDEPNAGFAFLRLALERAAPRIVYASSKASDDFIAAIAAGLAAARAEDDGADAGAPGTPSGGGGCGGAHRASKAAAACSDDVRIEKASLFGLDAARKRLLAVRVGAMGGASGMHALHARVRLDAEAQVRACGALIAILSRDGMLLTAAPGGGGDAAPTHLESICERALEGYLTADSESMLALGIFAPEAHPSQFLGSAKEGLSVFALLDTCITQTGKRLLKSWLLRPLVDVPALNARLDAVEFLTAADHAAGVLAEPLRRLRDTPRLLEHLAAVGSATPKKDFQTMCESIVAMLQLAEALAACPAPPGAAALFSRLAAGVDEAALRSVYELVARVVDFDADAESPWLIAHGVSDELDDMKHTWAGLPDFLTHMARFEMARIPPELCYSAAAAAAGHATGTGGELQLQPGGVVLSLEYIPKIGHCVRLQGRGTRPLSAELAAALPDYSFAFEGETDAGFGAYYFCDRTAGLDAELGDLFHRILDLEGAVLVDLKRRILECSGALRRAAAAAAEADALMALARAARALNLRRPTLGGDASLHIVGGRHLLTEQTVDVFIPNDAEAGADDGRVIVVTGPNFSGKSIYLKQVALIVFLAHVGSFVPADVATVPICDRIFARLAGAESVAAAVAQSAFMADAHRVAHALAHSTRRSLLVVDEFGKGTLAVDGAALLCATLDSLAQRGPQAPIALFATHFSEVHDAELLPRSPTLRFATMSVHATVQSAASAAARSNDDVVFLYKLVPGHAAPSYGLHCARLAGVPPLVVSRAAEVLRSIEAGEPLAPAVVDARLEARNEHCRAVVMALLALDVDAASAEELDAFLAGVRAAASAMNQDLERLTREAAEASAAEQDACTAGE